MRGISPAHHVCMKVEHCAKGLLLQLSTAAQVFSFILLNSYSWPKATGQLHFPSAASAV